MKKSHRFSWLASVLALGGACWLASQAPAADKLAEGFAQPPAQTKPWVYWYWISDNISKEGISRDLEAMARVGIGEALIGNIFLDDIPVGKTKVLTPAWWELIEHAIHEGGRTGVNIGMFNCPGWSQSGGPWIQPTATMRYLASTELRVTGPAKLKQKLAPPKEQFQDVALLAFPAPAYDADRFGGQTPKITATPSTENLDKLVDGDPGSIVELADKPGKTPLIIDLELPAPLTARSLRIVPGTEPIGAQVELQAAGDDGRFRTIKHFKCDRSNMSPGVGFMPRGPVVISFPATTARKFRLVFGNFFARGKHLQLAEISLSPAAQLESFIEKQLAKMHPTPLPLWDTYLWPTQPEPEGKELVVPMDKVRDISKQLAADGTLEWNVPAGEWVIQRFGMTPTGMRNSPASPEGQGLEVDKMNRELVRHHFDSFIGEILKRVPAADRKAFTRVVADSYEMGSQNWTDGLGRQFAKRYGYDPVPWLPVLSGRLVGSADQSERFLWDLRRLVADRVATDYVGGLRDAAKPHGLGLWLENYGHWGFPGEFLKYGGASDRIGGEYWVTGDLGSIECRAASSCANTYGKGFVSAEAFTGGPAFQNTPGDLKARGDWSFCEGVNHFVLHVYIQQPWEDKVPGVNAWFGTEFNRHNTWFEDSKSWVEYLRRSCWLLQQGTRVADAAYFIGEDAPKMTGTRTPALPPGRDFDYINAEIILSTLSVKDGLLTLPHGTSYRVLVLPELDTMRPEVVLKVRKLVKDGATVLGPRPSRSPSMENYPECDAQVRELAAALWGDAVMSQPGERALGKGRIIWGKTLAEVFAAMSLPADFESSAPLRFTHRRDGQTDIYFVANPKPESLTTTAAFRAGGKAPEFWWPDSGRVERPAVYDVADGVVRLPLSFGPNGSVFVVFREIAAPVTQRVVSVSRGGRELLGTAVKPRQARDITAQANNFAFAAWIKPAGATELGGEKNRGADGLGWKRNEVLAAPHGEAFGSDGHAGCGLAVGTNGVSVFEHGANYYSPILVFKAPIADWTHVAVVYREGQPSLYLNGRLARTGLKSEHIVHCGAGASPASGFRGKTGAFAEVGKALTEAEVAELVRSMPRPDEQGTGPGMAVTLRNGQAQLRAAQPGVYELLFADGKIRQATLAEIPAATDMAGPWEVSFTPGWDAPERVVFNELIDLTRHADPAIQYYSGKVVYRKRFDLPRAGIDPGIRALLDLGEVQDLAVVRLNGKSLGTLWLAPYQVDVTEVARPGENVLEVGVINPWNNRLAGDAALPAAQRKTVILAPTVKSGTPLMSAGLLGPVSLRYAKEAVAH